ncbi:MAG: hypothetical protein IKG87_10315 [Clostridia bacterium]|jgi:hypothetical protein|nr:hypothetical protein [Clostridia bacterium]MBR4577693.1 hypothetical protein [Clostridia bacterium]
MEEKPVRRKKSNPKHPPMDRGHRARIFASFDALEGFSEMVQEKDRLPEETVPEREKSNICLPWEDP